MMSFPENPNRKFDYHFNIKALISFAGVDDQYLPGGETIKLEDVNYLTIQGSHDMNVYTFMSYNQFDRVNYWLPKTIYITNFWDSNTKSIAAFKEELDGNFTKWPLSIVGMSKEAVFQNYSLLLSDIKLRNKNFDASTLETIRFLFDRVDKGTIYVRNIGIRRSD